MGRSTVTDRGLARRLGEDVFVTKRYGNSKEEGTLVYYPAGFAVLQPDQHLVKIKAGVIVGLRRGSGCANYGPHFLEYEYLGS